MCPAHCIHWKPSKQIILRNEEHQMSRVEDIERGRQWMHLRSRQEVEAMKEHSRKYGIRWTEEMLLEAIAAVHYGKEKVRVCTKNLSVTITKQTKQEEKTVKIFYILQTSLYSEISLGNCKSADSLAMLSFVSTSKNRGKKSLSARD